MPSQLSNLYFQIVKKSITRIFNDIPFSCLYIFVVVVNFVSEMFIFIPNYPPLRKTMRRPNSSFETNIACEYYNVCPANV